jgi:hypothetical protein
VFALLDNEKPRNYIVINISMEIVDPSIQPCKTAFVDTAASGAIEQANPRGYSRKSKFLLWFSHNLRCHNTLKTISTVV